MNTLIFTKKKFLLHLKANKVCKKIKFMFAFRQMCQKIKTKKKFFKVLVYYKAANYLNSSIRETRISPTLLKVYFILI